MEVAALARPGVKRNQSCAKTAPCGIRTRSQLFVLRTLKLTDGYSGPRVLIKRVSILKEVCITVYIILITFLTVRM